MTCAIADLGLAVRYMGGEIDIPENSRGGTVVSLQSSYHLAPIISALLGPGVPRRDYGHESVQFLRELGHLCPCFVFLGGRSKNGIFVGGMGRIAIRATVFRVYPERSDN